MWEWVKGKCLGVTVLVKKDRCQLGKKVGEGFKSFRGKMSRQVPKLPRRSARRGELEHPGT